MKKFKKVAIALTLAMLVAITATGCNACPGDQELYFNNSFDTDFALSNGKQEVCVYDLQVDQAFNEELTKSDKLNGIVDQISVEYGSYKTTLTQESAITNPAPDKEQWQGSDIATLGISYVYKLETELKLKLNVDGNSLDEDTITTTTYFCPKDFSYAPIHTTTNYDCANLAVVNGVLEIKRQVYTSKTVYNQTNYTTVTTTPTASQTLSDEYTFKSIVDNNQLLFVLRNMAFEVDSSVYLPTNSPAYKKIPSLKIANAGIYTETYNLDANFADTSNTINYTDKNVSIAHHVFNFCVSDKYNTGVKQYALIQASATAKIADGANATEALPYRAFLIKYVQPILAGGAVAGALVYKLASVERI